MKKFKRKVIPNPVDPVLKEMDDDLEADEEQWEDEEWEDEEDEEDEDEEDEEDDLEIEEWELDEEEDEDEDEDAPSWEEDDIEYDEYGSEVLSEKMAKAIRAGIYKPTREDPWSAHLLYNTLRDIGKL